MNIFAVRVRRRALLFGSLGLLLALAAAFACIGCSAWKSAGAQAAAIDDNYTTLAVQLPQDYDFYIKKRASGYTRDEAGTYYWADGSVTYTEEAVAAAAKDAPQVLRSAAGGLLNAALSDAKSLSSGTLDPLQYNEAFDQYPYSFCVLAVRCTEVQDISILGSVREWEGIPVITTGSIDYMAAFEVLDAVSLLDAYGDLRGARIELGSLCGYSPVNEDLSFPFEVGKTYLLRGFFQDNYITEKLVLGEDGTMQSVYAPNEDIGHMNGTGRSLTFTEAAIYSDGPSDSPNLRLDKNRIGEDIPTDYWTVPADSLPFWAEYEGDWREFLETGEGRVWKEQIIPWAECNQNSAPVVLTDRLNAVYDFNTGDASILEGRAFTESEYAMGSGVCLVSASFAQYNSLSLGDTIHLDFYETDLVQGLIYTFGVVSTTAEYHQMRSPLSPENRIDVERDYEIVGIYTAPAFPTGQYHFSADTIFVPKASVPDASRYEAPELPYLTGLILKNGTEADFEAYMESLGMGGTYQYLNMDFTDALSALEALEENAFRLLLTGAAVFMLALGISLYLMLRGLRSVCRSARLLGVPGKTVRRQMTAALAGLELAAVLLGMLLAGALFQRITEAVLSGSVALDWGALALCAAAEFAVLLLSTFLLSAFAASRPLMQKK